MKRLLPPSRRLRILEIGMGRGHVLSTFQREGHDVTGIDPGGLERELVPSLRSNATILTQDVEEVELAAGSFDLIYAVHVVEHLRDPASVFATCNRALRPGGILYLMTPNGASEGLRLFGERWWNLEDPTHVRFFTPRSISIMLSDAGFLRARVRTPIWDSLSIEMTSLVRVARPTATAHGVLDNRLLLPVLGLLLPAAVLARVAWPGLSPSMEVAARRQQ